MSIITKATASKPAKTADAQKIIYVYILVLIVLILCQLFTYDDFIRLIYSFWLPGGLQAANIFGCVIVTCELLALPFLLRMNMSPLMRAISMVSGWLVPVIWLFIALWINLTINSISNIGFLGTVISIIPGWWTVFIIIAVAIMAIWSSWGLWPFDTNKSRKNK